MNKLITSTALICLMASTAVAGERDRERDGRLQSNSTAVAVAGAAAIAAQQQGQSTVVQTNQNYRPAASSAVAPSMGGGNCNVGVGLGLSEVWGSMSTGVSWRSVPCAVQGEAADFARMGMQREAILHLAMWHKRMGKTLLSSGAVRTK